jgi:hypothetical protein
MMDQRSDGMHAGKDQQRIGQIGVHTQQRA